MRNWLTWSWRRQKNTKFYIYKLETQETSGTQFWSESKGLRTRNTKGVHSSVRVGDTDILVRQRKREFSLPPPFYSIQALKVLDDAHAHWKGPSA